MTKETIETSKLKAFLNYLADKVDEVYQQEVYRAIQDFLLELEQERQLDIDVDSLLASIQAYKDSFYDDFAPLLMVHTIIINSGTYAVLAVSNPDSPTDKHKVLVELFNPTPADIGRLNRIESVLDELLE